MDADDGDAPAGDEGAGAEVELEAGTEVAADAEPAGVEAVTAESKAGEVEEGEADNSAEGEAVEAEAEAQLEDGAKPEPELPEAVPDPEPEPKPKLEPEPEPEPKPQEPTSPVSAPKKKRKKRRRKSGPEPTPAEPSEAQEEVESVEIQQHTCDDCQDAAAAVECPSCDLRLCRRCSDIIHARHAFASHELKQLKAVPKHMCPRCGESSSVAVCQEGCCSGAAICVQCWYAVHKTSVTIQHKPHFFLWPCSKCYERQCEGQGKASPAIWKCETCQVNLCRTCWRQAHATNSPMSYHVPTDLYPTENSPLLLMERTTDAKVDPYRPPSPPAGTPNFQPTLPLPTPRSPPHRTPAASPITAPAPSPLPSSPAPQHLYTASDLRHSEPGTAEPSQLQAAVSLEVSRSGVDPYLRYRLMNYFTVRCPSKLPSVVSTLQIFRGKENELFARLAEVHGPEPTYDHLARPMRPGWRAVQSPGGDVFYMHARGTKQWGHPSASTYFASVPPVSEPAAKLALRGHKGLVMHEDTVRGQH